jgi:NAD(P)H dehydrogenase (quinone)
MADKALVTGAAGDTGRAAVKAAVDLGLAVSAMVYRTDARSTALAELGAEVVLGDLLDIDTIRAAMSGVEAAYFVWPVQPDLIHATVNFAQAAREAGVSTIVNLSQRSANRESSSNSCRDSFNAEQQRREADRPQIHDRGRIRTLSCACPERHSGLTPSPVPAIRESWKGTS